MSFRLVAMAIIAALMSTSASAEMIVINGRYVVSKESIRGYFYRQNTQTVFDIRWSDWSTRYGCEDTYDEARVLAASLNFTLKLKDATDMDFGAFLESEGFSGCAKF